jgi:biotin carboxyl carrier protein
MADLDLTLVRHALAAARSHKMATVELEFDGVGFSAVLDPKRKKKRSSGDGHGDGEAVERFEVIKSPFVGYYGIPDPVLIVGGKVVVGDVIGIVSILGIANEVESSIAGEVVEILVSDGDPVEFGQPIVRLRLQ